MRDEELVSFLQWALPRIGLRWQGFRHVRRQVGKRLNRRLTEMGLQTLGEYRDRLRTDPAEWSVLDGFCRITISCFYHDSHVFDTLGLRVLPELSGAAGLQRRPVRCWCAGCACGEEVYTLKLLWELDVRPDLTRTSLEITGTDADLEVLRHAEKGCYSSNSLENLPAEWRDVAFVRDGDRYCVRNEYRSGVTFRLEDIGSNIPVGPFGLILCRNLVFTYFELERQREMLGRIAGSLRDFGYLVIGVHERLPAEINLFEPISDCREILRKRSLCERKRMPAPMMA